MSEVKTKPLDCYLAGISTKGVERTITASEMGLKDKQSEVRRADLSDSSAKSPAARDSRK